ncbi:MAG: cell division protein FtsA [Limnochordia bacterium]|nr:cell division protein FtsA [Limnochordia bacterium]
MAAIQNLAKCVQRAGLSINDIILQPLASAEAVLTPLEKESGVLLVDIGGGTTDIAVFREFSVWHTGVIPVGGNHLTNDLSVGLRVGARTAEDLKIKAGWATVNQAPDGIIPQEILAQQVKTPLLYREVARIIEPRVMELFMLILQELKERSLLNMIPAGVVLTGGTSKLQGLCEMVSDMLDLPVRQGCPQGVSGLSNTVTDPSCATGVGLVLLAANQEFTASPPKPPTKGFMDRLRYWFGEFFEMSR